MGAESDDHKQRSYSVDHQNQDFDKERSNGSTNQEEENLNQKQGCCRFVAHVIYVPWDLRSEVLPFLVACKYELSAPCNNSLVHLAWMLLLCSPCANVFTSCCCCILWFVLSCGGLLRNDLCKFLVHRHSVLSSMGFVLAQRGLVRKKTLNSWFSTVIIYMSECFRPLTASP